MKQIRIIGIDLAKNSFRLHGAQADAAVAFRKKLSREKVLDLVGERGGSGSRSATVMKALRE